MNPIGRVFIGAHVGLYRLTKGRFGGHIGKQPVVLLTTTGNKTGKQRTVPVGGFTDGADVIVVASYAGSPQHPAWYKNMMANPDVTVQLHARVYRARVKVTSGDERARLWKMIVEIAPGFGKYQAKAGTREIPVVRLEEIK